ncbi:MAG: biotin transporter BioY, partial [Candidatus Hydrogenedentes bacterium]|nr:biotin transporter BioY [Candidatus Hydrogenedentota bacterium]
PVPITMQTLVVLMAGVMLGGGRGALSQGVYVLAGIAGLPIFSSMASGLAWLGGPTGGYLVGFIVAPLVISMVLGDSGSYLRLLLGLTAGTLTILVFGTAWFAVLSDGGLLNAINLAFLPFVPGAIVKIGLASAITEGVRKAGKRR